RPVEASRGAGVVAEDVEPPELLERARDNLRHLLGRPDVGDRRYRPAPSLANLIRDRVDTPPGPRWRRGRDPQPGRDHVGQDKIGALVGEPLRDGSPEP